MPTTELAFLGLPPVPFVMVPPLEGERPSVAAKVGGRPIARMLHLDGHHIWRGTTARFASTSGEAPQPERHHR